MTVEELKDLILEEWSASMSDSGAIWDVAYKKLQKALAGVSQEMREEAYALARAERAR